jgi:putative spermidine/putrescine transport system permease protein
MTLRVPPSLRPYLLIAPAVLAILLVFGGGLALGVAQSFGYLPVIGLTQPTLAYYRAVLSSPSFYAGLLLTLAIATVSTLLAAVLALATAMLLRRSFTGSRLLTFIYQVPLPVPHLVAAAGLVMLLTQSGIVARLLYAAQVIAEPSQFPPVFYDRASAGIVLVYVWKEVPFIGLVLLAVLKGIGAEYEGVAQPLGAPPWQRFRYVLLPLMGPGLVATALIVFAFMFGSFEIPLLLGARYPEVLPVMAYRLYVNPDLGLRPQALAIGVLTTVIVVTLLWGYRRLLAARRGV